MANASLKDRFYRYKIIDNLISSGFYPSAKKICEATKSSPATFFRDLDVLKTQYNAPIEFSKDNNGYYYSREFNLITPELSYEQLKNLAITKKLLSNYESESVYMEAASVLEKMFPSINVNKFLNRIEVAKRPKPMYQKEVCDKIIFALENNLVLDFIYQSKWEPGKNHRRIMPYQLVIDEGQIFLYGAEFQKPDETRLFNVCRIYEIQLTKTNFELPENCRFVQDFETGRFGAFQYDEKYDFEIEFYGDARHWVKECSWSDDQQIEDNNMEGKTVLKFSSGQWGPIERWLMSFCHLAKPIKPDWLVDFWKTEIYAMKKLVLGQTENLPTHLKTQAMEEL